MLRTPAIVKFDELAREFVGNSNGCAQRVELCPGDVVLVQLRQCSGAISLFWRCMAAGAVFVPIDRSWPEYLIKSATAVISPRLVVADEKPLKLLGKLFPNAIPLTLEDCAARLGARARALPDPASSAAYLFTSGSTGTPKAVVHSRGSLAHSAALVLETFEWRAGERVLNLAELHTMSGLRNALIAAPMGSVDWIPCPSLERANLFELMEMIHERRCDHVVAGPAFVRQLATFADRIASDRLASVQAIYSTGAQLSAGVSETVDRRFGVPVINYYGLTETGGICLSQHRENWSPEDISLGQPVGCEARLVNSEDKPSDEGELQIRSPQLMAGYLNDPAASARRFQDGWLKTGDVMFRDRNGRFHLRGRTDLFINVRSTDRIHPEEIETVLELHPLVAEAGVVGVEEPGGGERLVVLAVLSAPDVSDPGLPLTLATFIVDKLGSSRKPAEIRFIEGLPRLPSGKLHRPQLRALLQ